MKFAVSICSTKYKFIVGYALTGDTIGRETFFGRADDMREGCGSADGRQIWMGDWNSHVGIACAEYVRKPGDRGEERPVAAKCALITRTTNGGTKLLGWLAGGATDLMLADSFFPIAGGARSTWRLARGYKKKC